MFAIEVDRFLIAGFGERVIPLDPADIAYVTDGMSEPEFVTVSAVNRGGFLVMLPRGIEAALVALRLA